MVRLGTDERADAPPPHSMNVAEVAQAVEQNAVPVVFVNVLMQQLGLPVPAVPTMLLAGSLAAAPPALAKALAAAVVASVVADWVWYVAGRAFGYRVLAGLCRLSINPASCVNQTEARFVRWGIPSLVLAKFIPGFSTVAPPIAGAMRMSLAGFLLASGIGALLWAGLAMGAGWLLRGAVPDAIAMLDRNAAGALLVVALALATWLTWKLWQRVRFRRLSAVPHITPAELLAALEADAPPLLLDLRGASMVAETGPIPGAVVAEHDRLEHAVRDWPKDRPIVTLCACPEDAGAIAAARRLLDQGFVSVRPLTGGYEAWRAAAGRNAARAVA
jgi:membrane protein DedA with SNARE-associated domain/rhodanese-related sulfurtransferase